MDLLRKGSVAVPANAGSCGAALTDLIGRALAVQRRDWRGAIQREPSMPKLSDTVLVILSNAAKRDERLVLPLPKSLKGGSRQQRPSSRI